MKTASQHCRSEHNSKKLHLCVCAWLACRTRWCPCGAALQAPAALPSLRAWPASPSETYAAATSHTWHAFTVRLIRNQTCGSVGMYPTNDHGAPGSVCVCWREAVLRDAMLYRTPCASARSPTASLTTTSSCPGMGAGARAPLQHLL